MVKGDRRYRARRWGRRAEREDEEAWGRPRRSRAIPRAVGIALGVLALAALVAVAWALVGTGGARRSSAPAAEAAGEQIRAGLESAEEVARSFLAEPDPEQRLRWVCQPDEVRGRLADYPAAARSEPGEIEKMIGHGGGSTAFAVAMPDGEIRLLEVVETPEGPRVDWDAYARYGTASWEDLWSGKTQRGVVRTFCQPSSEAPEPFADREKWTGFRLSSPDMGQVALGFAKVGTVREAMMKKVVLGSPRYRQRFTLEVVRHEGMDEPLFEITRCLAVGWVMGERPVEEVWSDED